MDRILLQLMREALRTLAQAYTEEKENNQIEGTKLLVAKGFKPDTALEVLRALEAKDYIDLDIYFGGESYCEITVTGWEELESIENPQQQLITPPTQIIIGTATNSVIGNQSQATINVGPNVEDIAKLSENHKLSNEDQQLLKELIEIMKKLGEGNTALKKGTLSRFQDFFQRNSWITSAVASNLISFFISRA